MWLRRERASTKVFYKIKIALVFERCGHERNNDLTTSQSELVQLFACSHTPEPDIEADDKIGVDMPDHAPVHDLPNDLSNVTKLLLKWSDGDGSALEQLTPIIYGELLRLAEARLSHEYGNWTLEPAALVHEAYLRLTDQTKLHLQSRAHFYAIAANVMRRVLIDRARKRKAQKRDAGARVTLKTGMDFAEGRAPDSVALDDALRRLAELDERKSRAIELKFFGGMTTEEISQVLGISVATVGRELRLGQAWLRRDLSPPSV
jgi:RNA polymerase sigma factor (TIGR02999 family)